PRHGHAGLVGPAEGPPDLVERLLLVHVVGMAGAALGVDPDRLADLVHGGEETLELGPVEGLAADIGVDLHAHGAQVAYGPLHLANAGVARGEGGMGDEAGEVLGML